MEIIISNSSDKPIYEQISRQIKAMIISGKLKEGEALPSMRLLAKDLHISVITTQRAYEELIKDGFVSTIMGKGCFVATQNIDFIRENQLKETEGYLTKAVEVAKASDINLEDLMNMLKILYEEE